MSEPNEAPPPADLPGSPPPAETPPAGPPAAAPPAAPPDAAAAAPSAWQQPAPAAVAGPAPGVAYADLGIRIGAFIIDAILLSILAWFVIIALGAFFLGSLLEGNFVVALVLGVVLAIVNMVVSAAYFIWGWTNPTMRASLGQRVLGLQTLNAADGATLTRPQAARRWAFLYGFVAAASALQFALSGSSSLGTIASLIGLLSFGYTIFLLYTTYQSPKKQGYHDVQASTVVVKRAA